MNFYNTQLIQNDKIIISNYLSHTNNGEIISEIHEGLTAKPKYILSKYFYDSAGSKIFEDITNLPEYYPARTEKSILEEIAPVISKTIDGKDIIEIGSGDCSKISILLKHILANERKTLRYIPIDVSYKAIEESAEILLQEYPDIKIHGILADFLKNIDILPGKSKRLICFFGSTIGNLSETQAVNLLKNLEKIMNAGDQLLLGMDMVKDVTILEKAYNDADQVTAHFNKNILNAINNLANTNFDTDQFEHMAFYNENKNRIEMHLKAIDDVEVYSPHFTEKVILKAGETIHTENSKKFTLNDISNFADKTGLEIKEIFTDKKQWFSIVQFGA